MESAKKHQMRTLWNLSENRYYLHAQRKGWMDECCVHMEKTTTLEECKASAKLFLTRSSWHLKASRHYRQALKEGWLDECTSHMTIPSNKKEKPTFKECLISAREFSKRSHWQKCATFHYTHATKQGWLDECCKHMVKAPKELITLDVCIESAKEFTSELSWEKHSFEIYLYAKYQDWLTQCCKHMFSN